MDKKVYVVHWYYKGGMGFNWYPDEADRDKDFYSTFPFQQDGTFKKVTKFDIYVEGIANRALTTKEIDDWLHELL